jgi:hypothetical protein
MQITGGAVSARRFAGDTIARGDTFRDAPQDVGGDALHSIDDIVS